MLVVLAIYALLCLYGVKFHKLPNENYLSRDNTDSVKGIFILMVFLSHFNQYCTLNGRFDGLYLFFFGIIGQGMVTMFLFYSGYGVMESIKNKENYIKTIPKKRILMVLLQFDIAVILFAVLKLILGEKFTFLKLLLSFVGWEALGNSNWYIFVILCLYTFTYFSFRTFGKNYNLAAVGVTILTMLYILIMVLFSNKSTIFYDTVLCYSLGMFWSLHQEKIYRTVNKNAIVFIVLTVLFLGGFFFVGNMFLRHLLLTVGVVLFTMRVQFGNKILRWCGNHLFELYILQRIPMIIFKRIGLIEINVYLGLIFSLLITIGFALVYRKYVVKLLYKIINK